MMVRSGMAGCPAMFVQALVRLLSVGVPVAMIGLACWSPLLAASQSGPNRMKRAARHPSLSNCAALRRGRLPNFAGHERWLPL